MARACEPLQMMSTVVGRGAELPLRMLCAPWLLAARFMRTDALSPGDAVPSPRASLALGAKMALDEFFFLTELLSAGISTGSGGRIGKELAAAVAFYREHGWLDAPADYHRTPPPLDAPALEPTRALGLRFRHLRFESGYQPHAGEPGRERWLREALESTGLVAQ